MLIYLAGSVPKGAHEEMEFVNWRLRYKEILNKFLDAEFIMPDSGEMDESDFLLIVGKDSRSIQRSDAMVVNAEERLGAGTSMEMVIAKYFSKPVITVMPKDSYHRRSNMLFRDTYFVEDWMHPFIHTFSDYIIENISDFVSIKDHIKTKPIKGISIIDNAIKHREDKVK